MSDHEASVVERGAATDANSVQVVRGRLSWDWYYIALGFALSIEGSALQIGGAAGWPGLLAFGLCSVATIYGFIFNGWFQNQLVRLKLYVEGKAR